MELRAYWDILWRRMWVVISLILVVIAVSLFLRAPSVPAYQTSLRFIVGVPPEPLRGDYFTYDGYYAWLASEYLADDFSEVVKSAAFADAVTARLARENEPVHVPPGTILGTTVAEKQHRILTMHISWGDSTQLEKIAMAAAETLREHGSQFFSQLGEAQAQIHVIDPPVVTQIPESLRQRLDLPIRMILALVAGIFLAFLIDYLDDTVRDTRELEQLGLSVLGTIPPLKRKLWPFATSRKIP